MSASNEWTEWHLTLRGWERGSEKTDFGEAQIKAVPEDRVLSFKYREYMSSMHSKTDRSCAEIWRGANESLISELLAKFGDAPRRL